MDYIGADNPATEVAFILAYLLPYIDEYLEAPVKEYLLNSAVIYNIAPGRNRSGIIKCIGRALISIPLLYVVALRLWR